MYMRAILPVFFLVLSIILFFINLLGLMRLVPMLLTLPLLFLSIYLFFYTATFQKKYRGKRLP